MAAPAAREDKGEEASRCPRRWRQVVLLGALASLLGLPPPGANAAAGLAATQAQPGRAAGLAGPGGAPGPAPAQPAPHPAAAQPRWSFLVTIADLHRGLAEVRWSLEGFAGSVTLCADMDGAERYVRGLEHLDEQARWRPLPPPVPGAECWLTEATPGRALQLRYRFDLAALAAATGDPDYAARIDDDYVFNDEALLLRPEPLPRGAPIEVELRLPAGAAVAAPWAPLPGPGQRFRYDSDHYDGGSYVAIGRLRGLGDLAVGGGVARVHLLGRRRCRAGDDVLLRWLQVALVQVARFYGELPGRAVHIILIPARRKREPGVFGTILRRGPPSVVFFVGQDAPPESFAHDWVPVHELFHLGNARVRGRPAWFIEGFTTYYQDVLRARGGAETAQAMWADLHDGLRRHCHPIAGVSLRRESEELTSRRRYSRVYWGGACVALLLDVAIRERQGPTGGGLDAVLRALRPRGPGRPRDLTEDEVVAALDAAAGRPLVGALLDSAAPLPLAEAYERLGVVPTGPASVRLREDAPLAALRRQIM